MFKRGEVLINRKHKGDDVASFTANWTDAVMMNIFARYCGHVGNDKKILIDNGVVEFLRKLI